jgi:hypothetical protein
MAIELKLTDTPWEPSNSLQAEDAIYSLLIDEPNVYYITPNMQHLFLLVRGRGLVVASNDFSQFTEEEIDSLVNDIWEAYSA